MYRFFFSLIFLFSTNINLNSSFFPEDAFSKDAKGLISFPILKSVVSPVFYSMGNSGSTIFSHDSIFYNPAASIINSKTSLYIDFQTLNADAKRSDISYIKRKFYKTYGFYLSYIDYGEFMKIDNTGNLLGSFYPYDYILGFSYSNGKYDRFGFNIKYAYSNMVFEHTQTLCADIGFILKGKKAYYSFLLRNIGFPANINGKSYPLPFEIGVGMRYLYSQRLNGIFEFKMPVDDNPQMTGGFEYKKEYNDFTFYLRAGMNLATKSSLGWGSVFSGGFGVDFNMFLVDYAYIPYSNVDMMHKLAIKIGFGKPGLKKEIEKNEFKDFVAKQITMKKKIAVFRFKTDLEEEYGKIVANSIEERLINNGFLLITSLDSEYISKDIGFYSNINSVINVAKRMQVDYAIWGEIRSKDENTASYIVYLVDINSGKTTQFSLVSNIYDINNISLGFTSEISKILK